MKTGKKKILISAGMCLGILMFGLLAFSGTFIGIFVKNGYDADTKGTVTGYRTAMKNHTVCESFEFKADGKTYAGHNSVQKTLNTVKRPGEEIGVVYNSRDPWDNDSKESRILTNLFTKGFKYIGHLGIVLCIIFGITGLMGSEENGKTQAI